MSDNISRFNKYAPQVAQPKPVSAAHKIRYQAADIEPDGISVKRLRVNYSNGNMDIYAYDYLIVVSSTSPTRISLLFTSGIVDIEGENLGALLDTLHAERVKTLTALDKQKHLPATKDAPVIHRMDYRERP